MHAVLVLELECCIVLHVSVRLWYSKRGENALLRQVIIIIVNFTLLWGIDNRKRTSEWGASYLIHFLFLLGCPLLLFFSWATNLFILPKTSHPVDFLVVCDDWTTAS